MPLLKPQNSVIVTQFSSAFPLSHTQEAGCLIGSQAYYRYMQRWLGKSYGGAAKLSSAHFERMKGFLLNMGCLKLLVLYYLDTCSKGHQGRIQTSISPPSQWKSKITSPLKHEPMRTYVDMEENSSTVAVRPAARSGHLFSCVGNLLSLGRYAYTLLIWGSLACPAGE